MLAKLARYSIAIMFLLGLAGCNLPTRQQPISPAEGTASAQTAIAVIVATRLAETQGSPGPGGQPQPQASPLPAFTDLPTFTPSPTLTFTPSVPIVTVSQDTNCRAGPGVIYDRIGTLRVDQQAEAVGRNAAGDYWYIRFPDQPGVFCWLWGQYASVSGNSGALPVFTPPPSPTPTFTPTPTPDFTVAFKNVDSCVGWFIEFSITNNGGVTWESVQVTTKDLVTSTTLNGPASDKFDDWSGCLTALSQGDLMPGEAGDTNSGFSFAYNPAGHAMEATIKLCSQNGLVGTCLSKTLNFTP